MTEFQEVEFPLGDLMLRARMWGPEKGKPVLAIHGWMDNAASFDRVATFLPDFKMCALDLAGHGLSDHRPAGTAYHLIDNVSDILEVANQLGWERFSLFGHSLGACIATLVGASFPERIERAVLIEGLGPLSSSASEAPMNLRRSIELRESLDKTIYESLEKAVVGRMNGVVPVSQTAAEILCARGIKETKDGFSWRTDPRLKHPSALRVSEEMAHGFIRAFQVPTLLILASKGYPHDSDWMQKRMLLHPDLTIKRLEGSHHLHLETGADELAGVVSEFLN